jgi:uncharacterized protein YqeY
MTDTLKSRLKADMITAMKAKETDRLGTIRLINSAIKQREVDERIELTDADVLVILDKLAKQRRDSISQFETAGRDDLVKKEQAELVIIQSYLPQQLSEAEIAQLVKEIVAEIKPATPQDMGKVMAALKPKVQGRADMSLVSRLVKEEMPANE